MKKYSLYLGVLAITVLTIYIVYFRNILICENLIRSNLIDPDSAKFSKIAYSSENNVLCGYYNARNKMGGYVGARPFMCKYKDKTVKTFSEEVIGKEFYLEWQKEAYKEAFLETKGVAEDEIERRKETWSRINDYLETDEWKKLRDNNDIITCCKF